MRKKHKKIRMRKKAEKIRIDKSKGLNGKNFFVILPLKITKTPLPPQIFYNQ
jgi:hypothetical protein